MKANDLNAYDGQTVSVVTVHGEHHRRLAGTLRKFDNVADAQAAYDAAKAKLDAAKAEPARYELVDVIETERPSSILIGDLPDAHYEAIGLTPENVVSIDKAK